MKNSIFEEYKNKTTNSHVLWMIDKLFEFEGDKYNRWLGFIQGYFWTNDIYTIDELKEHNRILFNNKHR